MDGLGSPIPNPIPTPIEPPSMGGNPLARAHPRRQKTSAQARSGQKKKGKKSTVKMTVTKKCGSATGCEGPEDRGKNWAAECEEDWAAWVHRNGVGTGPRRHRTSGRPSNRSRRRPGPGRGVVRLRGWRERGLVVVPQDGRVEPSYPACPPPLVGMSCS